MTGLHWRVPCWIVGFVLGGLVLKAAFALAAVVFVLFMGGALTGVAWTHDDTRSRRTT